MSLSVHTLLLACKGTENNERNDLDRVIGQLCDLGGSIVDIGPSHVLASFNSSTDALLAGIKVSSGLDKISVHSTEIDLSDNHALSETLLLLNAMQKHCAEGRVVYSHPVYLTIHRSEVPSRRLTTPLKKYKLLLYELLPASTGASVERDMNAAHTNLSAVPIDQRVWATFLDLLILFVVFLAVRATASLENFIAFVNDVTVIEAEQMEGDNFYNDKFLSASAGGLASSLFKSTLKTRLSKSDTQLMQPYLRMFSHQLDPEANVRLILNNTTQSHANINTEGKLTTHRLGLPTAIAPKTTLELQTLGPPLALGVDQILFVPLGSPARIIETSARFETLDQLFRLNRENGWMVFFWPYLPLAFLATNLFCLTLFRGTPGCYLAGIRIVDSWGRPLGLCRTVVRILAIILSCVGLGAGFAWPIFTQGQQTWADIFSGSQVTNV